jgi:hypothetical protein
MSHYYYIHDFRRFVDTFHFKLRHTLLLFMHSCDVLFRPKVLVSDISKESLR